MFQPKQVSYLVTHYVAERLMLNKDNKMRVEWS